MSEYYVHPSSLVEQEARLGDGVKIWQFSHVRKFATLESNTTVGSYVYIGEGVNIGSKCKIQSGSKIYEGSLLESGVFIGPGVILTNDRFPRAVNSDESQKTQKDWDLVGVTIRRGASIGAGAVCVAPIEIGEWSMIAAGSVVTRDVPAFALVSGNPARFLKWVGRAGFPLEEQADGIFRCPKTMENYEVQNNLKLVLK